MLQFWRNQYKAARKVLAALSHIDQVAFAELVDKCHEAAFDAQFPANGNFLKQTRGKKEYWYYRGYARALDRRPGTATLKYVGPVDDPELENRIARFGSLKSDYRVRRDLASKLRRDGLPAPTAIEGAIVQALAEAGIFRLRATLVGSVAFQAYAGLLGVKFSNAQYRTSDLDVAQDHGISVALDDQTSPIEPALKAVDPTFVAVQQWNSPHVTSGYRNANGFTVEFLTTSRGKEEHQDRVSKLPALGNIGAQPLAFLDFLIRGPIRSVLLHRAGVGIVVPDPARYAVHKLIVSSRRQNLAKSGKDLAQSGILIEALTQSGGAYDLGTAWAEAFARGPSWRNHLARGAMRLADPALEQLRATVLALTPDATESADDRLHGFSAEGAPRRLLATFIKSPQ
jgi:hypothetical protein